jgi:hypothetical protein
MLIKKFHNQKLNDFLIKSNKFDIFKVGFGGGTHQSCISKEYNEKQDIIFTPLIDFNKKVLDSYNLKYDKIFIENRDYLFKKEDKPFEGNLHQDSYQDSDKSCYSCIYYYKIDKTIKGGGVYFYPFLNHKPKENTIIYFDGDCKHKVNKMYGYGLRGIVICSFQKSNL